MKKPNPYLIDEDNPEWTSEDFATARPASEVDPELVAWSIAHIARKRGQRGPQKRPKKVAITLRIDQSTLDAFKAGGKGYQTRMAEALRKAAS